MAIVDSIIFWASFLFAIHWTIMSFKYHYISSGHSSSRLVAIAMWLAIGFFKQNQNLHEAHLLWVFPAIFVSWFLLAFFYGITIQAVKFIMRKL